MSVYQLGPATRLSPAQVMDLWRQAGGSASAAPVAAAIVFGVENPEGNAGLVNDTPETGDYSIGLWQVNYYGGLLDSRSEAFGAPEDFAASPLAQAHAAVAMSGNGSNWQPWGPDLGYDGYGEPAPTPLAGSKVARWLTANGYGDLVDSGIGHGPFRTVLAVALGGVVSYVLLEALLRPRRGRRRAPALIG